MEYKQKFGELWQEILTPLLKNLRIKTERFGDINDNSENIEQIQQLINQCDTPDIVARAVTDMIEFLCENK